MKKPPALTHNPQKSPPRVVVCGIDFQVTHKFLDAFRQKRNLYFRTTRIACPRRKLGNNLLLLRRGNGHRCSYYFFRNFDRFFSSFWSGFLFSLYFFFTSFRGFLGNFSHIRSSEKGAILCSRPSYYTSFPRALQGSRQRGLLLTQEGLNF